jgi:hypothetical protein
VFSLDIEEAMQLGFERLVWLGRRVAIAIAGLSSWEGVIGVLSVATLWRYLHNLEFYET